MPWTIAIGGESGMLRQGGGEVGRWGNADARRNFCLKREPDELKVATEMRERKCVKKNSSDGAGGRGRIAGKGRG